MLLIDPGRLGPPPLAFRHFHERTSVGTKDAWLGDGLVARSLGWCSMSTFVGAGAGVIRLSSPASRLICYSLLGVAIALLHYAYILYSRTLARVVLPSTTLFHVIMHSNSLATDIFQLASISNAKKATSRVKLQRGVIHDRAVRILRAFRIPRALGIVPSSQQPIPPK